MKTKEKKQLAEIFLSGLAVSIIKATPQTTEIIRTQFEKSYQLFILSQSKEVVQTTLKIRRIFEVLAQKLIDCEDPDQIDLTASFINKLNTGDIMIAADDQEIIFEEK